MWSYDLVPFLLSSVGDPESHVFDPTRIQIVRGIDPDLHQNVTDLQQAGQLVVCRRSILMKTNVADPDQVSSIVKLTLR